MNSQKKQSKPKSSKDSDNGQSNEIVRAAIYPGIGVARVGDAEEAFFIGPEVAEPLPQEPGFYRTSDQKLKRQAARFRIYGYNALGEVVRELTAKEADIRWRVHVANRKANWFHFIQAMDIPSAESLSVTRRNPKIKDQDRHELVIDPGSREISGVSQQGPAFRFDSGKFKGNEVYLGELQTDSEGRLLFLGGYGKSASPSGKPPFKAKDPDSFNNAADWYDDMSDGPVNADVEIEGRSIPVEGAWVVTTPPNYAPQLTSWRTLYDLMVDLYTENGWYGVPQQTCFTQDVLPLLKRFSNLQWVNKGFAAMYGKGCPMDFDNPAFIAKLAQVPLGSARPSSAKVKVIDPYGELRNQILNAFRPHLPKDNEPRLWPWLYGDDFGGDLFSDSPETMLALPSLQQLHLTRWAAGDFVNDWETDYEPPRRLEQVAVSEQPHMLDRAAMTFCLADAFHPGCELTWPMRHASMYQKPFRIRPNESGEALNAYDDTLTQRSALAPDGPLYAQIAGGLTRWMGLPWQGDTAFCRSGYDPDYDLYLPSFWPARVPNTVLTEEAYQVVMNTELPREVRIMAYNERASWNRFIDRPLETGKVPSVAQVMERMVAHFAEQGIIEARPGLDNDPDFPPVIYVENARYQQAASELATTLKSDASTPLAQRASELEHKLEQAGWASKQQWQHAVALRRRKPTKG